MSKKIFLVFSILIVAALLVSACASATPEPTEAPPEPEATEAPVEPEPEPEEPAEPVEPEEPAPEPTEEEVMV
ncbi:MAG: hypothetical protein JJE12_09980, partial [Anaerolineales bacterium]|nr:hypothetical protein [Anaerolineales bacterium]